jgi:tripartite-type tricarboxylate transporter receptor subunit TctC
MKTKRSGLALAVLCTLAVLVAFGWHPAALLAADDYPSKSITIVVPMVAGGQFDLGARVLAAAMEKQLKQPVVVVDKPGAAGTIGTYSVVSSKPDGYTLGYLHNSAAVPEIYSFFYAAPYSSNDLVPICRVHMLLNVIAVKGDAPWNSMKELVEYARKNPGALKFGHNGKASSQYVIMSTIAKAEKLNLVDVPYDGDGAVIPALLGGHVPVGLPAYAVIKSQVAAKKLKILATCTEKRSPDLPDVPSLGELGYKLPYVVSVALYGPKKLPDGVVKKLDDTVRKIVADKEFQKKNAEMDMIIAYEDATGFQNEMSRFKENVSTFFKEQGMVKK